MRWDVWDGSRFLGSVLPDRRLAAGPSADLARWWGEASVTSLEGGGRGLVELERRVSVSSAGFELVEAAARELGWELVPVEDDVLESGA